MKSSFRFRAVFFAVLAALFATPALLAQNTSPYPSGPVPVQIYSAKKLFISNADPEPFEGKPYVAYSAFYAAVKGWGNIQIVAVPADADLVFVVSYFSGPAPKIFLTILDPKTRVVLWKIMQPVAGWGRDATGRKNFDTAMNSLLEQVKTLMTPPLSGSSTP